MFMIVPLFTTLLQTLNYDPPKDLIDYINQYYDQHKYRGKQRSSRVGWQSKLHKIQQLQPVQDYLQDNIHTCQLVWSNAWININHTGAYNISHVHPNCDFTCVYYLTDECSNLVLEHPHLYEQYNAIKAITDQQLKQQYNIKLVHKLQPSKGDLLIFPAYLPHRVEPNTSNNTRISLSWGGHLRLQKELTY
ncbi:2OG-Fe(II) oxygenase [Synechococcus phage ACG-2014i]|uniref:Uncharacterized protein n=1 Tax=Synechococcus phage ACG-2014i TaxID=1493513 RepID=A0A0E3HEH1_9CAUD|nr:2OG-Fe(II) oxygenase [Synechococcus phage ACG-2014i]AIX26783.1 hypothetical protein Syn7803US120_62 [Synechococcus phage ACG-2014i]